MAKWGEGDPRWIVEERADAKNVNNWHWTEKNASPWSKERLRELFKNLKFENGEVDFEVNEISKVEGEATANNRKAKLIFFYEWEIELKWTGSLAASDEGIQGKIEIPNLSEEHAPEDVDVLVTVKSEAGDGYKVKNLIREHVTPLIREKLGQYIKELREKFSQGMILPTKDSSKTQNSINDSAKSTNMDLKKMTLTDLRSTESNDSKSKGVGVRISTKQYTSTEEFLATAEDLYDSLTQKDRVRAFCRSEIHIDPTKGGLFSLFNGNITGKFVDMITNEKLVMEWRFKEWPDAHHSVVTMDFKQKDNTTEIKLTQTGIPASDYERTKSGWRQYYWESIRHTFCFGLKYF